MTQDDDLQAEFESLLQKYQDIVSDLNVGWDPDAPIDTKNATPAPLAFLRRLDAHMGRPGEQKGHKRTLLVDFDGVLHSYISGWKGIEVIPDPPVAMSLEWLTTEGMQNFEIHIFSARSKFISGRVAMQRWLQENLAIMLKRNGMEDRQANNTALGLVQNMHFPEHKPSAFLTIDDRAITFTGQFPSAKSLLQFKPWNKQ